MSLYRNRVPLVAAVAGPSRPPARCGSSLYVGLLRPQLIVAELKSPRVEFSLALGRSISTWAGWYGKLDVSLLNFNIIEHGLGEK